MKAKQQIEAWLDCSSDVETPTWCVSLCHDDGEEIKLLSTHETERETNEAAMDQAAKRNLVAYARAENGGLTTLGV